MAVLRGMVKHLIWAEELNPGVVIDHEFVWEYTTRYDEFPATINNTTWEDIEQLSGLTRGQLLEAANLIAPKQKLIACRAMGLTQQKTAS